MPTVSVDTGMIDVMRTGEKVKDFAARKADTPAGRQKLEDAVRASRAKQLTAYAKDIEDDYAYMNRGLMGGTKITKDRLQTLQTTTDRSVLPRSKGGRNVNPTELLSGTADDGKTPGYVPRMTQSIKKLKGIRL